MRTSMNGEALWLAIRLVGRLRRGNFKSVAIINNVSGIKRFQDETVTRWA